MNTPENSPGGQPLALGSTEGLGVSRMPRDWPPRISYTPEGIAAIFLAQCGLADRASSDTQFKLAEMLKEYWRGGYDAAKRGDPRA